VAGDDGQLMPAHSTPRARIDGDMSIDGIRTSMEQRASEQDDLAGAFPLPVAGKG
jgi:hypothetical protein